MTNLLYKLIYSGITKDKYNAIKHDITEENRRNVMFYSYVIICGMALLLVLSLFVDVLVSSRLSYIVAIGAAVILLFISKGPAAKIEGLTVFCQYLMICFLLGFGIFLGTVVEPNQTSASFGILIFVAPLLFTDLPVKINTVTAVSIIVYIFAAKATQNQEMFGFNLSVILPYGITNLVLTYVTMKIKLDRIALSHTNKLLSEKDQLTSMLNRRSFEHDLESLKQQDSKTVGVCSFDVNGLKSVNDSFGHKAGDALLLGAAAAIDSIFGKYGKCYRIGGDEFMALIGGVFPSPEELIAMLNRETAEFRSEYDFELSISTGITVGDNNNAKDLVAEADRLMYLNKSLHYQEKDYDRRKNY